MAARTAARAGLKVLLVEKNKKIGHARRLCSRLLRLGAGGFRTDVIPTDIDSRRVNVSIDIDKGHSIIRPKNLPPDATIEYTGTWGPCFNDTWISPSGYTLNRDQDNLHFSGFVVDKDALLEGLADEAEEAGCELRAGCRCVGITDGSDAVSVTLKFRGGKETLRARRAIVADGAFSPLIEPLGINEGRPVSKRRIKFLSLILDGIDLSCPAVLRRIKFCLPSVHKGYITLGPWPPGQFQLGASTAAGSSVHLPSVLRTLMSDSPYSHWFSGAQEVARQGCNMEFRLPVPDPARGNVICIGDNVAYAETAIKGAIGCGYMAAEATLSSLQGKDGNESYNDYWQHACNYFSPEYKKNVRQIKKLPAVLDDREIDSLFKWIQDNRIWGVPEDCLPANRAQLELELPEIAGKTYASATPVKKAHVA